MSFDLYIFDLEAGPDELSRAHERMLALNSTWNNPGSLDSDKERMKQVLAGLIMAANPLYTPFDIDHKAIANWQKITEDEAKTRYRYVELDGPPDKKMAQIVLHDDWVTIHWYSGTNRDEMIQYLRLLCTETGWAVYDPQAGKVDRSYAGR
jgi:hypothetical protein